MNHQFDQDDARYSGENNPFDEESFNKLRDQFEREEAEYKKKVETILLEDGNTATDGQRAGFEVIEYTGLTFVFFKDPCGMHDTPSRIAQMKRYQEALKKKGIPLNFYDGDPSEPYLCG